MILDVGYVEEGNLSKTVKTFFDLSIGYALVFKQSEDYWLCLDLLKMAKQNMSIFQDNLFKDVQSIDQDEELCNNIFKSKLIQCLAKNLQFDSNQSLTEREKLALEMIVKLVKIHERAKKEIEDIAPLGFQLSDSMKKALKTYKVIEEGPNFNSFLSKMKF